MNLARRNHVPVRKIAALLAALGSIASPLRAFAESPCAHETFTIDASPVAVTACASKSDAHTIVVAETFKGAAGSTTRSLTLALAPGTTVARGIDDIPLRPLGSSRTLHLTFAYRTDVLSIEHALLLPGAVPLK